MKKDRRILGILLIILLSYIAGQIALANKEEQQKTASKEEINKQEMDEDEIVGHAEEFTQDEKKGIIILEKNVKIYRQDGYMFADKVTLYQDVNTNREVIKTVAEGNVELADKDILAHCDHAVFDEIENTVELTGSVVLIQNEDRIEATYLKYNRKTGQRTAKGSPDNPIKFRVKIKTEEEKSIEEESNESKSESEKQK